MNEKRQCKATTKSGQRCKKDPILGGFVCQRHGGGAPHVQRAAAERLADLIDPDRALREAARLAYSDIRDVFDDQGRLKPIKQWPDGLASAIGGIEVVKRNVDSADGKTDDVIKLKVWDKPKALEMLFKHLGLLEERLKADVKIQIVHELS
jgi:hypothetical protein